MLKIDRLLDFGFRSVHQNNLVYVTCWEDPRLDRVAMKLTDSDTVLVCKRLLQGREELYQSLIQYPGDIWLDLGGGTGANLESIDANLSQFKKFYIVDLCPSLLGIAKQRIITNGWSNVETVEANVTQFTPPEKMVDIVTFSYSLTMIPDWFAAIDKALDLLKPGGIIGVIDFYVSRKYPLKQWSSHSVFSRYFWPAWFAKDNVFLSSEHAPYLHHRFESVQFIERMANLPFLPGIQVPYYIFIGRKKTEID